MTANDPAAFAIKGLEEQYAAAPQEIGTASLRLYVALYLGLPYNLSGDNYLPNSAAALLQDRPCLGEAERAYVTAYTLGAATTPVAADATADPAVLRTTPAPEATHQPSSDAVIRGKTTFADLGNLGLSGETVAIIIGGPIPAAGLTVKDYGSAHDLSFETVKSALEAALP